MSRLFDIVVDRKRSKSWVRVFLSVCSAQGSSAMLAWYGANRGD